MSRNRIAPITAALIASGEARGRRIGSVPGVASISASGLKRSLSPSQSLSREARQAPLTSIVSSRAGGPPEVISARSPSGLPGKLSKFFPVELDRIVDLTEGHKLTAVKHES